MVDAACTIIITEAIVLKVNGILKDEHIEDKIILIIKGIEMIAIKIAENGSGLKLKYCPFEKGSVNKNIMSIATIRTTPQEIRKSIFGITIVEDLERVQDLR
jgi:hypothetical protein